MPEKRPIEKHGCEDCQHYVPRAHYPDEGEEECQALIDLKVDDEKYIQIDNAWSSDQADDCPAFKIVRR